MALPRSANHESLRVLMLAGIRLVDLGVEEEEPSAPHARLAFNHLQDSLPKSATVPNSTE
jgi:hypothetical protein